MQPRRPRSPQAVLVALLTILGAASFAGAPAASGAQGEPTIETFAGGGIGDGRAGLETHLSVVLSLGVDGAGDVYWTENNHIVGAQRARAWDAAADRVRTVAGTGLQKGIFDGPHGDGGPALQAVLHNPFGIAADSKGNVYVYDTGNARIRRVDVETGVIDKVVDAFASGVSAIEIDAQDRVLFAAGNTVRRYDPATGVVTTIAGGGSLPLDDQPATQVSIGTPSDIETDAAGNIYVSDTSRVRWIDTQGVIHTLAGGSLGQLADDGQYGFLTRLAGTYHRLLARPDGSLWYTETGRVRRIAPEQEIAQIPGSRRVTTVFGVDGSHADGPLAEAGFEGITDWEGRAGGSVAVADGLYVRLIEGDAVRTVVGTGLANRWVDDTPDIYDWTGDGLAATDAFVSEPCAVAVAADGDVLVTDLSFHYRVRRVDADSGIISTVAGNGIEGYEGDGGPATSASLGRPCGLAVAPNGDTYIADGTNRVVRMVDAATGTIRTVAGDGGVEASWDGPATEVSLQQPVGLAFGPNGDLYIADAGDNRVRRLSTSDGWLWSVAGTGAEGYAGDGAQALAAKLSAPRGVASRGDGTLVIADTGNDVIRAVDAAGRITTIAGDGNEGWYGDGDPWRQAAFSSPNGLALDPVSGTIFVSDTLNQVVRRLDPDGIVRHVTGTGDLEYCGDGGPAALACVRNPQGLAVTAGGDLLIADYSNIRVRIVRGARG